MQSRASSCADEQPSNFLCGMQTSLQPLPPSNNGSTLMAYLKVAKQMAYFFPRCTEGILAAKAVGFKEIKAEAAPSEPAYRPFQESSARRCTAFYTKGELQA
ncbi:hypothetical protein Droror1_Dr00004573 [Drosera rotundifolia]